MIYAYARVSTDAQDLGSQTAPFTSDERPELKRLMAIALLAT
jgi:DNA invertase Pin-like site-specific DNA recombinase